MECVIGCYFECMQSIKKVLIIKNRMIGDSILTLSSLSFLREILPDAEIHYGVPKNLAGLFLKTSISANKIIQIDSKSISGIFQLFKVIFSEKYDFIIELNQSSSSRRWLKMICKFIKTKYFFHNHHRKDKTIIIDQGIRKANIQRDLDACWSVLKKLKVDTQIPNYLNYPPRMYLKGEDPFKNNSILFGIVATRSTKMWPLGHFFQLARLIEDNFPNTTIRIPLSKSLTDQEMKKEFLKFGNIKNLEFVERPLSELPFELAKSILYIGNDTGLKHIAAAIGIKSYTFFGPEEPLEWHPYDRQKHPYFFIEDLECRTRTAHFCGLSHCESMICLNQFSPELVFSEIENDFKNNFEISTI